MALTPSFNIKRDDVLPVLSASLVDPDSNAVDLSGASVEFIWRLTTQTRAQAVSGSATINNAAQGDVEYAWADGDTATAGVYIGEFQITFANSKQLTVPNTSDIVFRIYEDVGAGS